MGNDYTIHSNINGIVKFFKKKKKTYVSVEIKK